MAEKSRWFLTIFFLIFLYIKNVPGNKKIFQKSTQIWGYFFITKKKNFKFVEICFFVLINNFKTINLEMISDNFFCNFSA